MSSLMPYVDVCIANEEDAADVFGIRAAFPFSSASTSSTVTILKSFSMECFRQDAATANSMLFWGVKG